MHSKFGWSYPPGCSGPPDGEPYDPSELQENVLQLLEAAGMPTERNDRIMKEIDDWEREGVRAENAALDEAAAKQLAEEEKVSSDPPQDPERFDGMS